MVPRAQVLPLVLLSPEVYIFVTMHAFLVFLHYTEVIDIHIFLEIGMEPWKMMALTTSVLSFFIIFLLNQCYDRYKTIYMSCTGIMGGVQTTGALINVNLSAPKFKKARWTAMRYLLASVELVYFKVNDGDFSNATVDAEEWQRLVEDETIQLVKNKPPILSVRLQLICSLRSPSLRSPSLSRAIVCTSS